MPRIPTDDVLDLASSHPLSAEDVFLSPRVVDEGAFEDYAGRLRKMLEHAAASAANLRDLAERLDRARVGLDELGERYNRQMADSEALSERIERSESDVHALLSDATDRAASCAKFEETLDGLIDSKVRAFELRLARAMDDIWAEFDARANRQREACATMLDTLAEAHKSFDAEAASGSRHVLEELRQTCAYAEKLAGIAVNGDGEPAAQSLQAAIDTARNVSRDLRATTHELRSTQEQARAESRGLEDSVEGLRRHLQILDEKRRSMEEAIRFALSASTETESGLTSNIARAEELAVSVESLQRRAEEACEALSRETTNAENACSTSVQCAAKLADTADALRAASDRLDPWRAVLLEGAAEGALPPAILSVIEHFRAEIGADLGRMASAMNAIASRAMTGVPAGNGAGRVVVRSVAPATERAGV